MKYYFSCPLCGNDELFVRPSEDSSGLGCALLLYGGWLPFLIFARRNRNRVQCSQCAHIFQQPALPVSPTASLARFIILQTIVCAVLAFLFFYVPNLAKALPAVPILTGLENAIAAHPRVAAYILGLLFWQITIPCLVVAAVSAYRFHKQLAARFRLMPVSSRQIATQSLSVQSPSFNSHNAERSDAADSR